MDAFKNPILPGFYPDPSICRAGEDYYLITSSFEYFPGVPIFHSRDLIHWRQIGHVLDRAAQLPLDGVYPSQGIYAPTLRYHNGRFYMVVTIRQPSSTTEVRDLNIIVTATDPAGPWSETYVLIDEPGIIDPTLFFDDDDRAWYCANSRVDTPPYPGYRDIWLQELDLNTMTLTGARTLLWNGAFKEALAPEAPHIYKVDGMYYLLISEGGTFHEHAVTIARADTIHGPYQGNPRNPILTHRHLGLKNTITNPGHADMIDTPNGEWWMVALASRPCGGYFYNLGRETFLTPVIWEDGWPVVNPPHGCLRMEERLPDLPKQPWPVPSACDHFDQDALDYSWNFIRTPREKSWSLDARPNYLRLQLRPESLSDLANPSCLCRRQQHHHFAARTAFDFIPQQPNECAGMVLLQNNDFHFRLTISLTNNNQSLVTLIERRAGIEQTLATVGASTGRHFLKVEAHEQEYSFYYAAAPEVWIPLAEQVDGRLLSTQLAGGFVGAMLGLYASSNGKTSDVVADFSYFEYLSTTP